MKEMKAFLHITGAISIGLIVGAAAQFPMLAIGVVIGYFAIQQSMTSGEETA